jgi:DNA-binding PadR family transcriptional regulator
MESIKLAKRLEGLQTVESVQEELKVARSTAIKLLHQLRKDGFLTTSGGRKQKRLYNISPEGFRKEAGMFDIINRYSKVKIAMPFEHKVIGRKLSVEETIVRAISSKQYRIILTSLGLFNHVKDWFKLYNYAKQFNACHDIGALYDVARTMIRVRKMNKKVRILLKEHKEKQKFIIPGLRSKDFKDIEEYWKIKIPLNKADLMRYKEI